jgi:type I restriction enzyme M protein
MPKLSLAKLERHLYSAADRLRQEGLDAATYKDYIFGMLFLKRCSDVFDAEREKIVGTRIEQGMAKEKPRATVKTLIITTASSYLSVRGGHTSKIS